MDRAIVLGGALSAVEQLVEVAEPVVNQPVVYDYNLSLIRSVMLEGISVSGAPVAIRIPLDEPVRIIPGESVKFVYTLHS